MAQEYYCILTNAGLAYEAACKANQVPIKLTHFAVGDGNGAAYNPGPEATALRRETHRQPINSLLQDEANPSWLMAEAMIADDVGGWTIREVGIYTDTGLLYAIGKYPDSVKPILAQGSGKQFYVRAIFQTSNATSVTLLIDNSIVMATRVFVLDHVKTELAKLDHKNSVRVATTAAIALSGTQTIDGIALIAGDRALVKNQAAGATNGIYVASGGAWARAADADISAEVTPGLIVTVEQGATLADTRWQLVTDGSIVLGTTTLTFQDITKGFAPLSSPAFTDNPTAPTAPQFDTDQSLATTGFVQRALGNLSGAVSYSANRTLTAEDAGKLIRLGGTGFTITLPLVAGVADGATFIVQHSGTGGTQSIVVQGTDVIDHGVGLINTITLQVGDTAIISKAAGNWALWSGSAALLYAGVMAAAGFTTPTQFANDTKLATTEFVQRALGNMAGVQGVGGTPFSVTAAHAGKIIYPYSGASVITLPEVSTFPEGGVICIQAAVPVTVSRSGTNTIFLNSGGQTSVSLGAGDSLYLVATAGSNGWFSPGNSAQLAKSSGFGSSLGASGYKKIPDANSPTGYIIEQWGTTGVIASGANLVVPLTIAFPNAIHKCLTTFAQGTDIAAGGAYVGQARGYALNSVTIRNLGPANAQYDFRVTGY